MNVRRVTCAVGLALAVASSSAVASAQAAADPAPATYYLALGDSLSVGYQAAHTDADGNTVPAGDTDQGYADDLYATLHTEQPNLQLQKLGCSGETTTTMLNGSTTLTGPNCDNYKDGNSQVKAAVQFLTEHPGAVKYVTIDIGANDVQRCATAAGIDIACAVAGIATIAANLPTILTQLRAASGAAPVYVGMNYYNPFLASYLTGSKGMFLAAVTSLAEFVVNNIEENAYRAADGRIADVSGAFHSYDFFTQKDLPTVGPVPLNVYNICTLTYMCAVQNIHANAAGYQVIADTFSAALAAPPKVG